MPKAIQEMCERRTALSQEIESILGTDEAPRQEPLTAEDRAKLDALETEDADLAKNIDQHKQDEDRRKRQAARKHALATTSAGVRTEHLTPGHDEPAFRGVPKFKGAHRYKRLRAFTGPDGPDEAFLCGQFFLAKFGPDEGIRHRARKWCQEHDVDLLAMSTTDDMKGGALVPEIFEARVIDLVEEYGRFRANAMIWPMTSDTAVVPRRTGGLTVYSPGENQETTASDLGWDSVRLTARTFSVLAKYSAELGEDSIINIMDRLALEAARAFAKKEDECGFLGDGTSTYFHLSGLITECAAATATVYTALAGNTAFSTLDLADFEAMMGQLPEYAEGQAKWYLSRPAWAASMLRLIDAGGGNTRTDLEGKATPMFLGYPVVITQVMNKVLTAQASTNGLCYFGDLAMAATVGDRRGVSVKASEHRYIELGQIGVYVSERLDINVHDVGDTSSAGAMVMLATPAE